MRREAPVQLPENLPQAESIAEPQDVGTFDGTFDALGDILPATGLSIGSAALGAWSSLEELGRPMRQRLVGEGRDVAAEMAKEADVIEEAVNAVLDQGYRTGDILQEGCKRVSCSEMGDLVAAQIG